MNAETIGTGVHRRARLVKSALLMVCGVYPATRRLQFQVFFDSVLAVADVLLKSQHVRVKTLFFSPAPVACASAPAAALVPAVVLPFGCLSRSSLARCFCVRACAHARVLARAQLRDFLKLRDLVSQKSTAGEAPDMSAIGVREMCMRSRASNPRLTSLTPAGVLRSRLRSQTSVSPAEHAQFVQARVMYDYTAVRVVRRGYAKPLKCVS